MNSIDFLDTSWGGGWRANWIFWILSLSMVSILLIVTLSPLNIYQNIISLYPPYIPLPPTMRMPSLVLSPTPIATGDTTPEQKMVYAFGVEWDKSTLTSVIQNRPHIDALIMEELSITATGIALMAPDKFKKTQEYLANNAPDLPLHILISNHNPVNHIWDTNILYTLLSNPTKRRNLELRLRTFAIQNGLAGINIDFEELDVDIFPYYLMFLKGLSSRLHAVGKTLSVDVPISNSLYNLSEIAKFADLVFLMAYDEHWANSAPGPIASRDWFTRGIERAIREIPRDKLVVALGNYGYDWVLGETKATSLTLSAIQTIIEESVASVISDPTSSNPLFYYLDESNRDHVVWYLDSTTVQDEIRILESLGIKNISLWRIGSEDREIWNHIERFAHETK